MLEAEQTRKKSCMLMLCNSPVILRFDLKLIATKGILSVS